MDQIERWVQAVRHGAAVRDRPLAAGRWHVLRYEALVQSPHEQVKRLVRFVDLPISETFVKVVVEATSFSNLPSQQVGEGRPFGKRQVGDRRNHFTEDDSALFERHAGGLLEAAGYCW
ncbi:MAG: sulfotransferase domain-containing protein [Actinobacteria bacterium]|nr:sulfotransferase domain-containing protein [Actinomycetota bacterium]